MTEEERIKQRKEIHNAFFEGFYGYVAEKARDYLQIYPRDGIILIDYAESLSQLSRYEEAISVFNRALECCDESFQGIIFSFYGGLNQRRGNYQEAEKWYRKSIDASPEVLPTYILLAVMLMRVGALYSAEDVLRHAITLEGDELDEAYLNLGGVFMGQERFEEAEQCYQEALRLTPDYGHAKIRLEDVRKLLAR